MSRPLYTARTKKGHSTSEVEKLSTTCIKGFKLSLRLWSLILQNFVVKYRW